MSAGGRVAARRATTARRHAATLETVAARDRGAPRPDVIVDVVEDDGLLFLAIANIGAAPAVKVACTFDRALVGAGGETANELALFKRLDFLAPGRAIRTFVDSIEGYFRRRQPARFRVDIAYRSETGASFARRVTHNVAIYRDLVFARRADAASDQSRRCTTSSPNA